MAYMVGKGLPFQEVTADLPAHPSPDKCNALYDEGRRESLDGLREGITR